MYVHIYLIIFFTLNTILCFAFLALGIFIYMVTYIHDSKPMFYGAHFKDSDR